MGEITISIEEYKKLVRLEVRVEEFANHVNREEWRIDRETCARMLGFELENKENAE